MNSWLDSLKSVKITSSFFGKNNEFPLFVKKIKIKLNYVGFLLYLEKMERVNLLWLRL